MNEKAMRRKTQVLFILVACFIVALQPMAFTGSSSWDVASGWRFYSGTSSNSGPVTFGSAITATQIQIASSLVTFTNFDMGDTWSSLGFHAPMGATMEIQSVSTNLITCSIAPGAGYQTWNIYVGSKGVPVSVTGIDSWGYSSQTVSLNSETVASVQLSWVNPATESPTIVYEPSSATDFLDAIETNFVNAVIVLYTGLIGPTFWVFITLIGLLPLYNRIGIIPIIVITLILWVDLVFIIPAAGLQIGMAIIILGGAAILTMLFFARRRQYG